MTLPIPPQRSADLWILRQPPLGTCTGELDLTELDAAEQSRAGTCRREAGRLLYSSAHVGLRRLLSAYLGTDPRSLRLGRDTCPCCDEPHGRPVLDSPDAPLHFSLSHSNGMALIGIAPVPIGVDVEKVPTAETVRVCTPALHPREQGEVAAERQDAVAFGQLWTRKEAYLKGLGTGLGRPLSVDYLGADPTLRPAAWKVIDVPCGPQHVAAAALYGTARARVRVHWLAMECLYKHNPEALDHERSLLTELAA
ncbi:4'-phosphopantetheinyl transferase superfamily protein [Streptomyces sp. AC602_WCS936]|uniref:4'-phosphopantetheinyl transferase family protein n=1 Tax=Streptomyces sp. AC602_WCS936 TaxID=2823685 RepID=UPI001C2803AB|nr:4'-phosphopantetheinyl transferase superfamily protein [Streptomyces sp. AC602_WCS936]